MLSSKPCPGSFWQVTVLLQNQTGVYLKTENSMDAHRTVMEPVLGPILNLWDIMRVLFQTNSNFFILLRKV